MQSSGEYAIRVDSSECDAVTSSDTSEAASKDAIKQHLVSQDSVTMTGQQLELLVGRMSVDDGASLDRYIALLKERAIRNDFKVDAGKDLRNELSRGGKNVLHLLAEERQFSKFQVVLKDFYNRPMFTCLLDQASDAEGETPIHAIAFYCNVAMMRFLLASTNPEVPLVLKAGGVKKTKTLRCNAFLALGHFLLRKSADAECERNAQELYRLFVELYGPKDAAILSREQDSKGRDLFFLAEKSSMSAFAQMLQLV